MNDGPQLRETSVIGPPPESMLRATTTPTSGGTTLKEKSLSPPSSAASQKSDGGWELPLSRLCCTEMMPTEDELRGTISGEDRIQLNPGQWSLEPLTSGWNTLPPPTSIGSEEEWTEDLSGTDGSYEYEWQF